MVQSWRNELHEHHKNVAQDVPCQMVNATRQQIGVIPLWPGPVLCSAQVQQAGLHTLYTPCGVFELWA